MATRFQYGDYVYVIPAGTRMIGISPCGVVIDMDTHLRLPFDSEVEEDDKPIDDND